MVPAVIDLFANLGEQCRQCQKEVMFLLQLKLPFGPCPTKYKYPANERRWGKGQNYRRKAWSRGCQGIYDILCAWPPSQPASRVGDMLLRATSRSQPALFAPRPLPSPFLCNQRRRTLSSSSLGQRVAG